MMALGVLEILPYKRHQNITRPESSPSNKFIVFVELLGTVAGLIQARPNSSAGTTLTH